jgi:hypothetical protein
MAIILFDRYENYNSDIFSLRFRKVSNKSWKNKFKRFYDLINRKEEDKELVLINLIGEKMSTSRNTAIVKRLQKGQTLREIADVFGIDNKVVYRVGEKAGVYSVRSKKNVAKAKSTKKTTR